MSDTPKPLDVTYDVVVSIRHIKNLPYPKKEGFGKIMKKHGVTMSTLAGYNHENPDPHKRVWSLYILVPKGTWDAFKKDVEELLKQ